MNIKELEAFVGLLNRQEGESRVSVDVILADPGKPVFMVTYGNSSLTKELISILVQYDSFINVHFISGYDGADEMRFVFSAE